MTKLQEDLTQIYKELPDGWRKRTIHNARLKLQCHEQLLAMHDAMGDALELAHEIDEEQESLHNGVQSEVTE